MIVIATDTKGVKLALDNAPPAVAREIAKELRAWSVNGVADFTRAKLRAPDDRNRGDFLLRRPRTSQGLRAPTGGLRRGLVATNAPVKEINDIRSSIGFLSGRQAMIATVHELGTIRYGGSLPDIVPKRGRFLSIPVGLTNAARSTKFKSVLVKKVGIPPRLGFRATFHSRAALDALTKRIAAAARRGLAARA